MIKMAATRADGIFGTRSVPRPPSGAAGVEGRCSTGRAAAGAVRGCSGAGRQRDDLAIPPGQVQGPGEESVQPIKLPVVRRYSHTK